jgi:hypothetical protein
MTTELEKRITEQFIRCVKHRDEIYLEYSKEKGFKVKFDDPEIGIVWLTFDEFYHDFYINDDEFFERYVDSVEFTFDELKRILYVCECKKTELDPEDYDVTYASIELKIRKCIE